MARGCTDSLLKVQCLARRHFSARLSSLIVVYLFIYFLLLHVAICDSDESRPLTPDLWPWLGGGCSGSQQTSVSGSEWRYLKNHVSPRWHEKESVSQWVSRSVGQSVRHWEFLKASGITFCLSRSTTVKLRLCDSNNWIMWHILKTRTNKCIHHQLKWMIDHRDRELNWNFWQVELIYKP